MHWYSLPAYCRCRQRHRLKVATTATAVTKVSTFSEVTEVSSFSEVAAVSTFSEVTKVSTFSELSTLSELSEVTTFSEVATADYTWASALGTSASRDRCIDIPSMLPKNMLQTERRLVETMAIPIAVRRPRGPRGICWRPIDRLMRFVNSAARRAAIPTMGFPRWVTP